jgi:Ca-activated chloride channel family protein
MLRFAAPWVFLLVLPVLLVVTVYYRRRRSGDARILLPRTAERARQSVTPWLGLDRLMPWLRGLVLLLIVVALARPQAGERITSVSTFGVDIVIALDISGSMRAEDFQPSNRLVVARQTVERFIADRPTDRIGLVVFASLAATRSPLTQDHEMLGQFLDEIDFAPPETDGTAIGNGLATALNRLRESEAKSKVVVLVTDGRNNAGQIGPIAAAEAASALGVTVYTIGVGTDGEVPIPGGAFGRRMVRIELDEDLLREIADITDGQYFRATAADELEQIFVTIDEMEKTEISSNVRVVYSEHFEKFLWPALLLFMFERLLVTTRLRRLP